MRLLTLSLIVVSAMSTASPAIGHAQTSPDSIKPKKAPSKLGKIAERVLFSKDRIVRRFGASEKGLSR